MALEVDENLLYMMTYNSHQTYLERRKYDIIFTDALNLVTAENATLDDKKTAIRYLRYVLGQYKYHQESVRLLQIIVSSDNDLRVYCSSLVRQPDGNYAE
jgi:hypothetical protein